MAPHLKNNMQEVNKFPSKNLFPRLFFIVLLLIGFALFTDYGISTDEPFQRGIGLTSLAYLANLFNIGFLLDGAAPLADPGSVFLAQRDRDYGVAFELPAEFLIKVLNLSEPNAYFFRHLLTFLIFYLAVYFFYKLVKLRYQDWRMGLLGAAFLVLSPRIFGDSFFNDKDLVFMSAFAIGIYTLVRFVLKPGVMTGLWHALACALAIDLRLMAVILPAATLVTLLALLPRKELSITRCITSITGYLALTAILVVTFWPWLWLDPLGNFATAFANMARFRHAPGMIFMGDTVFAHMLPWYYIPVWIGISTPILYLVLFIAGTGATVRTLLTNLLGKNINKAKTLWANDDQLQDLLFLGLFLAPLLAVIVLHSVLYNGWRQMYFIYPAFVLVAIRGLVALWSLTKTKQFAARLLIVIVASCMTYTGYWMVRWHPYQYLYFNVFAGQFAKKFDVDYWAVAYRPLLEKVVGQDPREQYSIYVHPAGGATWGTWQLDYHRNLPLIPPQDRSRIINDRSEDCSDYIITVPVGNRKQYLEKKEFELFDELKVDGQIIYTTFKRKVPIYEYYSPAIGKPVDFSSGHTKCFLSSGWASNNEDWGIWSVGNTSELRLFMPKEKPKYLVLDLRAFVNAKQLSQSVEISVDGQNTQKLTLNRFEGNLVKIPIPTSAYGKEWLTIDFKIPGAISPKALGIAPDDRLLGIGLKSAVFE
jgi:hypothetical protein